MLRNSPLLKFTLLFLFAFFGGLALFYQGGLNHAYGKFITNTGNALFQNAWDRGLVNFTTEDQFQHAFDGGKYSFNVNLTTEENGVVMLLDNPTRTVEQLKASTGGVRNQYVDFKYTKSELLFRYAMGAFLPFMMLISLIIASPVNWTRKVIALLLGTLLIHVFIFFKIYLKIHVGFQRFGLEVVNASERSFKTWDSVDLILASIGATMMISVLIWIGITFRAGDLKKLLQVDGAEQKSSNSKVKSKKKKSKKS